MNCMDVERAIVELGAEVPGAIHEHVAGCAACRQFAALHQVLLADVTEPAPAAALDARVRTAARRRLRRGWRRVPGGWGVWLAAAAAVVLVGVPWVLNGPRQAGTAPGARAAAPPPASGFHSWAVAQVDLTAIEDGLEAALAELGSLGAQGQTPNGSLEADEPWDPLMELEFDVYFESQDLRPAGG